MNKLLILGLFLGCCFTSFAQKDSLQLGDRYAEDQLYFSIAYAQLVHQPSTVLKSNFSYSFSTGFIKDIILNKQGSISFAAGVGLGYSFFNHQLKVDEFNGNTVFNTSNTISENVFKTFNLELPLELRWRTSNANKYSFWRVYTGVKFMYNVNNTFQYLDANNNALSFTNINSFNNLQYGLTLSAGYDEFTIHIFYSLSPIFNNGNVNGESIDTRLLKFGLIFYFL